MPIDPYTTVYNTYCTANLKLRFLSQTQNFFTIIDGILLQAKLELVIEHNLILFIDLMLAFKTW